MLRRVFLLRVLCHLRGRASAQVACDHATLLFSVRRCGLKDLLPREHLRAHLVDVLACGLIDAGEGAHGQTLAGTGDEVELAALVAAAADLGADFLAGPAGEVDGRGVDAAHKADLRTVFFDQGHYIVDLFGDTSSDILHQNMQKELQNEKSQPITSTDLSEITEKDEEEKPDNRSFKPGERIIGNTVHGYINNQFNEAIPEYAIPMAELQDGLDPELMPHDLTAQEYKEAYQILRRQPIEITIFQSNVIANTAHSKIAQFLKSNFEKNGIRTTIKNYRNTRGINNLKRGNFDMAIVNVFSDSTSLIFPLISCKKDFIKQRNNSLNSNLNYFENYTGWCNEKLDNMHESLSFLDRNDSDAVQLRKFIKNILVNEMPIYPLVYNINQFVSLEYVKGLESTPSGGVSFINAYLEKPAKKKKRKQVQNYQGTPLTEETTQKTDGEVQK